MKKLILILGLTLSLNANAQTSGNCGPKDENGKYTDSCTWSYDSNTHTLKLSGDGYMSEFDGTRESEDKPYRTTAPWSSFSEEIYNVDIGGNLKNVGACAIYCFPNLENTTITAPIESLRYQALQAVRNVEIPSSVTDIGLYAFGSQSGLNSLVIPDSVKTIGDVAFAETGLSKLVLGSGIESLGADVFRGITSSPIIYCEDITPNRCANIVGENNPDYVDRIQPFTKDPLTGVYCIDDTYYASAELLVKDVACKDKKQCDEIALKAKSGFAFEFNGKFYASLKDMSKNQPIKKRIYTIDEANAVAGEKNRVSITYR